MQKQENTNKTQAELEALLARLQAEYRQLEAQEPREDSPDYMEWMERLEEMDDRMDAIQDALEKA